MGQAENYVSKAKVFKISATSRTSIRIKENYFTVEYSEERAIPDIEGVNIEKEREILWDTVNAEVDNQAEILYNTFNGNNR